MEEIQVAQEEFLKLSQEDADRIFQKVAQVSNRYRLPLAKLAAEETGMGCFEDKVMKNGLSSELIFDRYRDTKTCGLIKGDRSHGVKVYAYPAVSEHCPIYAMELYETTVFNFLTVACAFFFSHYCYFRGLFVLSLP